MSESSVWLAESAYLRLKAELTDLLRQRADETNARPSDNAEQNVDHQLLAERDNRIRKLQELLQNPVVGQDPPDDGVAEPGMLLTIRYEDDQETETFLLSHYEEGAYPDDLTICSPDSPLGSALPGKKQGDRVQYALPNGQAMEVTLLHAVPYRPAARSGAG